MFRCDEPRVTWTVNQVPFRRPILAGDKVYNVGAVHHS